MEPVDFQDELPPMPGDDPARQKVRAIKLTSASSETAAREAYAQGGFEDRARGFTILIFMGALFISAVWPAAIFAFLVALLGFQGIISLGAEWWVMIAAGALFPLPPIWIAVITWARARDLARQADRLGELADRLLHPDQTASHEIATVGMAIRREVESLSSGVETALDKVRSLEGAVAAQAMAIDQAAFDAETRAEHVRGRMEQERKALGDITASLKTQTEAHAREMTAQTQRVEDVTEAAQARLEDTTRQLERQGTAFARAADAAVAGSQKMAGRLEDQVEALNTVSDQALAHTDTMASRYQDHQDRLVAAASTLGAQNERLEGFLGSQRDMLGTIAELIGQQNEQIATSLSEGSARLETTLEDTVQQARSAAQAFKSEIENVAEGSENVVTRIGEAAERARALATSAGAGLDDEAARVLALVREQTETTRDVLSTLFNEFDTLYQTRAGELKTLTTGEIATLHSSLDEARETAARALSRQSQDAHALISQASAAVDETTNRLSGMFTRLLESSEQTSATFLVTSARVDEHMETLPGLAEETANKIREVLDEELNAFAGLADESARKIRALNQAYSRHIPGAPRAGVLSAGGGFAEPGRSGILGEARALPQKHGPSHSGKSGEWAWGEVLAAADRPFENAPSLHTPSGHPPSGQGSGARAASTGNAEAFSQSSLQIFEALQSMAVDLDRALETDPPRDLLRRYLNGEKAMFTQRLKEISSDATAGRIHDKYLEDTTFRNHVNQYIEQFEGLLNEAMAGDQDEIMIETFMSSTTGKVYFLLGGAIGHFG